LINELIARPINRLIDLLMISHVPPQSADAVTGPDFGCLVFPTGAQIDISIGAFIGAGLPGLART
jgi:hypothetical protein